MYQPQVHAGGFVCVDKELLGFFCSCSVSSETCFLSFPGILGCIELISAAEFSSILSCLGELLVVFSLLRLSIAPRVHFFTWDEFVVLFDNFFGMHFPKNNFTTLPRELSHICKMKVLEKLRTDMLQ